MYLVVWTDRDSDDEENDQWTSHPTYAEAKAEYDKVTKQPETFIASICAPIVSTDYATPRDAMLHAQNFED
jgi:hypothetical protein